MKAIEQNFAGMIRRTCPLTQNLGGPRAEAVEAVAARRVARVGGRRVAPAPPVAVVPPPDGGLAGSW